MADNPFNAMLDPSKQGTITGFIGGMMGSPTASQAAGSATGEALRELSTLRAGGASPQEALIQFLQTPKGQDYFTQAGPDGLKSLTDGLTATVPPSPTLSNVPQGGRLFSTDQAGKTKMVGDNPQPQSLVNAPAGSQTYSFNPVTGQRELVGSNPTNEQQNFSAFSNIARLPAAKIRELAELHADPTAKVKDSDAKVAVDNLIKNYGLDPVIGSGILAGTIKVLPIKDAYNADTGRISIVDITRGVVNEIKPGEANKQGLRRPGDGGAGGGGTDEPNAVPEPAVGVTPATGGATGVIPAAKGSSSLDPTANKKYFGSKATMFLGAGVVPNVLGAASKLGEQISPELIIPEGAVAEDRKTLIAHTRNALLSLSDNGGFGVNRSIISTFKDLLPSDAITESPHSSIQKGIRLLQGIQGEIAAEEDNTANPKLPPSERVAAAKRAEGWRKVERTLPSMEEMAQMEGAIRNGTAGAQNVEQGVKTLLGAGKKVLSSGKEQAAGVEGAVRGEAATENAIEKMAPAELLKLDPRTLSVDQNIKLRNRIQQLRAGSK